MPIGFSIDGVNSCLIIAELYFPDIIEKAAEVFVADSIYCIL